MRRTETEDTPCVVTISGDLGSGKSTVGRLIAAALGCTVYSAGDMQRRMAASMGLTSLELNKLSEGDPTIDQRIDSSTVEIAQQEKRVIFDSRLAWHFVPDAFKVFLTVDPVVGARRIMEARRGQVEEYASLEQALERVQARRASEEERFQDLYGIRLSQLTNYHLVLDSSFTGPEAIAERVVECATRWQSGETFPGVYLSPRTPFPTGLPQSAESEPVSRLRLLRSGRHYFVLSGLSILSAALREGRDLVEATLAAGDDTPLATGETCRSFVEREATPQRAHSWEESHGFTYPSYPPHFSRE